MAAAASTPVARRVARSAEPDREAIADRPDQPGAPSEFASAKEAPPAACSRWELWANSAFAISAMVAAVMRLASAPLAEWWTPVVIGVSGINGLIAVLFLIRRPVVAVGTLPQLVSCLPTMIGFGLAVRLAPAPLLWPWHAHTLFAAGVLMTMTAFLTLGTSFGVLPALREIVVRGPYRLVRHPAYVGELLMALACFVAGPSTWALSAWLLLLPGAMWRILAEERVLSRNDAYAAYQQRMRWRLVPGVW